MATQNIKTDEICDDPQIAYFKQKQLNKLKGNSLLNSIADTFKFMAGVLTTVAMAVIIPEFAKAAGASGFMAGVATVSSMGAALLIAAAATTLIAVASSYKASRIWHDGQFNNYEISAKSTAHHIVQELKANNTCLTEGQSRADGKSWTQYNDTRKAAIAQQSPAL